MRPLRVTSLAIALFACAGLASPSSAQNPLFESESGEAAETAEKLDALREQNASLEARAAEWAEKAATFELAEREAPERLAAINAEIRTLEKSGEVAVDEGATLEQLDVMLLGAEQDVALAQQEHTELGSELDRRSERRRKLPELLAEAKTQLAAQKAQPPPAGSDSPEIAEERERVARNLSEARENQVRAYEQELLSFEARGELLERRIERAKLRVARAEARRDILQETVTARRESEAERAAEDALASLGEADALSPSAREAVLGLATENAELARIRTGEDGLIEAIEDTKRKLQRADQRVNEIDADYERLVEKVESSGLSDSVGLLLRKTRSQAPDVGMYRRFIRMRQTRIAEVQARQDELRDELEALSDMDALVEAAVARLVGESPESDSARLEALLRDLLETKRKHLRALQGDYDTYFQKLVDFDARQQELVEKTDDLLRYIDERILWIPSGSVLHPKLVRDAWDGLGWFVTPRYWAQLGRGFVSAFHTAPLANLSVLLLFAAALPLLRRIGPRLADLAAEVRRPLHIEIRQTFEALGLVIFQGVLGPAAVVWVGWRLGLSPDATQFVRCFGYGLFGAGLVWLSLEIPRRIVQRDGPAEAHFGWPADASRALHRDLGWLIGIAVPLVFLIQTFEMRAEDDWRESIGRLCLIALFMAATFFTHRLMREVGSMRAIVRSGGFLQLEPWKWRAAHLASVAAPLVLAAAAARGYYWTAVQLGGSYHLTLVYLFAVLVVLQLSMRGTLVARRHLAFEHWEKERAARAEESSAAEHTDEHPVTSEPEIDLATVDTQTQRLLSSSSGIAILLGLWFLWSDSVPAIGVIELWSTTETTSVELLAADGTTSIQGQERVVPITLGNLFVALLTVFMTLAVVRNLPGLLEISLFRRLGTHTGERYAYTTIAKYTITLLGGVLAFKTLGVGWSNIQWLVAAVGLGLGFGLQEIFANFVSGLIILFERPIRVGDTVTVGNVSGTVSKIRIRATWITGFDRKELVVPNKEFVTTQLVNWSLTDSVLRVEVPVGIAYGSDTERAMRVLFEVAAANPHVIDDPKPQVYFLGFGASSLDFELRCFSPDVDHRLIIKHELHLAIDHAFREAGIEIAFPQRDLHLRSVPPGFGGAGPAGE
jgi:potassium efflux system protein